MDLRTVHQFYRVVIVLRRAQEQGYNFYTRGCERHVARKGAFVSNVVPQTEGYTSETRRSDTLQEQV
ncbi:hypothetical protein J6590_079859 [Homalodisca vitripennis]|nr:hypothetical protein J6590_079859 [Homalodisca vitripennis]